MLPEDATDAGLLGVSFFGGRGLSMPFSGGECAGLARGVAGSWRKTALDFDVWAIASSRCTSICHLELHAALLTSLDTSTTRSSLFSPSLSCEDNKQISQFKKKTKRLLFQ